MARSRKLLLFGCAFYLGLALFAAAVLNGVLIMPALVAANMIALPALITYSDDLYRCSGLQGNARQLWLLLLWGFGFIFVLLYYLNFGVEYDSRDE